jgi:DDE superfamily endonuclease
VVWDHLPAHHATVVRTLVEVHPGWLRVVHLAAYAPELDSVEGLWSHLKTGILVTFAARSLDHLVGTLKRGLKTIQYRPGLINGFLVQSGLVLESP